MKRYEKVFYIIEAAVVALFTVICFFVSQCSFDLNGIIILILSLALTALASALNSIVLILQKRKDKRD